MRPLAQLIGTLRNVERLAGGGVHSDHPLHATCVDELIATRHDGMEALAPSVGMARAEAMARVAPALAPGRERPKCLAVLHAAAAAHDSGFLLGDRQKQCPTGSPS